MDKKTPQKSPIDLDGDGQVEAPEVALPIALALIALAFVVLLSLGYIDLGALQRFAELVGVAIASPAMGEVYRRWRS